MLWYKELEMRLENIVTILSAYYRVDRPVAWERIEHIAFWKNIKHDGEKDVETKICWRCKKPLMDKLTKDEIGGNYEYETFKYKARDGTIKTNYCCLVCQMEEL